MIDMQICSRAFDLFTKINTTY